MEFLSTCYASRGQNKISLLLQQYRYGQSQVFFACVCLGEGKEAQRVGSYMAKQLLQWFRGLHLKRLFRNQRKGMEQMAERLSRVITQIDKELEAGKMATEGNRGSIVGMFCLGDKYLRFCRGAGHISLINTAFGHVHVRCIGRVYGRDELDVEQGILQPNIVLLFAMETFYRYVTEDMIKEGLAVDDVMTEEQMDRHLGELAKEGERLGGTDMGAVLLRIR